MHQNKEMCCNSVLFLFPAFLHETPFINCIIIYIALGEYTLDGGCLLQIWRMTYWRIYSNLTFCEFRILKKLKLRIFVADISRR